MKLIKENTSEIPSFYQVFGDNKGKTSTPQKGSPLPEMKLQPAPQKGNLSEKYFHYLQNLILFEGRISNCFSLQDLGEYLKIYVKRIIAAKEVQIFFIDQVLHKLKPIDLNVDKKFLDSINHIYKQGIIDWILETKNPNIVPEMSSYTEKGIKLNILIYPILEGNLKRGFLAILTTISKNEFSELESSLIYLALKHTIDRIDKLELKETLSKTMDELQTYQAKLANDFRLSAIGELSEGIIEDIGGPLQVIMTCADLLAQDGVDDKNINTIKSQVHKINFLIGRLAKFASLNDQSIKINSIDINKIVSDFAALIKSSLDQINFECALDLEENLQPILSHANYINQLLINSFGIVKAYGNEGGGAVIQTRFNNDSVFLKIISTAIIEMRKEDDKYFLKKALNLNVKIIESLMRKHEGEFKIENLGMEGSIIILKFPLIRKLRE
jgi:signal transduction histidine kinase